MEVAFAAIGASQQRSAGKIAEMEGKVRARQIETAAAAREADRKSDLARAAASQSAAVGASGVSFEGSPLSVLQEDIRRADEAGSRDAMSSQLEAMTAKARGKVASKQATGLAATSLLKSVSDAVQTGASPKAGAK
jgi:hypothetical protein